jgi:plasmid stabilization system protein ParE
LKVTLTELAKHDWRRIRLYLRRQFGHRVEIQVANKVKNAVSAIAENPHRGHRIESAVFPDLRAIVVKKSLICYRVLPARILIVRILDARQDTWTILKVHRIAHPHLPDEK